MTKGGAIPKSSFGGLPIGMIGYDGVNTYNGFWWLNSPVSATVAGFRRARRFAAKVVVPPSSLFGDEGMGGVVQDSWFSSQIADGGVSPVFAERKKTCRETLDGLKKVDSIVAKVGPWKPKWRVAARMDEFSPHIVHVDTRAVNAIRTAKSAAFWCAIEQILEPPVHLMKRVRTELVRSFDDHDGCVIGMAWVHVVRDIPWFRRFTSSIMYAARIISAIPNFVVLGCPFLTDRGILSVLESDWQPVTGDRLRELLTKPWPGKFPEFILRLLPPTDDPRQIAERAVACGISDLLPDIVCLSPERVDIGCGNRQLMDRIASSSRDTLASQERVRVIWSGPTEDDPNPWHVHTREDVPTNILRDFCPQDFDLFLNEVLDGIWYARADRRLREISRNSILARSMRTAKVILEYVRRGRSLLPFDEILRRGCGAGESQLSEYTDSAKRARDTVSECNRSFCNSFEHVRPIDGERFFRIQRPLRFCWIGHNDASQLISQL